MARPIRNSDTGSLLLMRNETGTRTAKAPIIPSTITKDVYPIPL